MRGCPPGCAPLRMASAVTCVITLASTPRFLATCIREANLLANSSLSEGPVTGAAPVVEGITVQKKKKCKSLIRVYLYVFSQQNSASLPGTPGAPKAAAFISLTIRFGAMMLSIC